MKKIVKTAACTAMLLSLMMTLSGCSKLPPNAQVCPSCNGTKICSMCDGDGVWEFPDLMGGYRKCSYCLRGQVGACRTCKGQGYVISQH